MEHKDAFALEDTLAVYGIDKNPFPIDETDEFFFSTPMLEKQFDVLRNLVEYGELLLVVSGVEGAGKTTFLNQVFLVSDKRWSCCRIDGRPAMTIGTLVDELLDGFGLTARGDDAQGDEALLREHLSAVHADGNIAIVAVDDAHLLPQICIEFLLTLAENRDQIELRLLLSTEPGRLGFPTNDPKRVHVVVLQPLDVAQTGDYIHTRLSHAGLGGDSPFSAAVIDGIYQDSAGLPGTIHSLALHTLLANTDTSLLSRRSLHMPRAMIYVVAALAVAGAVALFLRPDTRVDSMTAADATRTGTVRGSIAGAMPAGGASNSQVPGHDGPGPEGAQPTPFTGSVVAKAPASGTHGSAPSKVSVQTAGGARVFSLDEAGTGPNSPIAAATTAAKSQPSAKDETRNNIEAVVRLASNVTPSASTPTKSQARHDLDWLRKQNPSHYVIQLVGTRHAAAAGKFVDDHKLGSKAAWFVTSHENKPWYVVVYGIYPDNASARAAIKTLPDTLRAGSPWPRSVASVVESAR
jgi:DamX protein